MSDFTENILSRLVTKAFAPRPVIRAENPFLVIESGWRTALLTLGGRKRRVTIDPNNRIVRIQDRTFWFVRNNQVITFDRVQEVVYTYRDIMGSNWFSHTEEDLFRVGLWLRDGKEVILFRFYGQGDFVNNSIWPDWMKWDEIIPGEIVRHNMESESQVLAGALGHMIGVPVGDGPGL
ncbi:MAG: hypothetical protein JST12_16680 [Armatimonadetes bacterium]|nr:hypothetical protein [Armatimonadota bacterium]MBS1703301.1 hypothetical protein [Armatimonadota bacterium]MBS1726431.1 hypothetical protein [Armatimonadota bacterium]